MTDEERDLAKKAVRVSVEGLKDRVLLNISFPPDAEALIEQLAQEEIFAGEDDIDRISNPEHPANKVEKYTWFTEYNSHHPM